MRAKDSYLVILPNTLEIKNVREELIEEEWYYLEDEEDAWYINSVFCTPRPVWYLPIKIKNKFLIMKYI